MLKKAPRSRKHRTVQKDSAKEAVFRGLSAVLGAAGYLVRREQLKQGFGFKVASGCCQADGSKIIFVERRLAQDDQNSFLIARIRDFEVPVHEDELTKFPAIIQKQLRNEEEAATAATTV